MLDDSLRPKGDCKSLHDVRRLGRKQDLATSDRIALVLSAPFHSCGWNVAANIEHSVVGDVAFRNYSAVVLTALAQGKQISVFVDGCVADRARVTGIKIAP
jgi:hypothetical protein